MSFPCFRRFKADSGLLMKRELVITPNPIDEQSLAGTRQVSAGAGAVVSFMGYVRGTEDGAPILALQYEAFQEMAEHQFSLIFDQVEARWPVASVRVVHRVGTVDTSQPSLWVEVIAPHRAEAFAACQWLVDEMKKVVPIWKKPVPVTAAR